MKNNKNKKSVKFQGGMLNFYDFIQVFVFTTNHHLNNLKFAAVGFFQGTQEPVRKSSGKRAISVGATKVLLY